MLNWCKTMLLEYKNTVFPMKRDWVPFIFIASPASQTREIEELPQQR